MTTIKDFNGVGDGKTDDTWAIQKACNYFTGISNAGPVHSLSVFFPTGTYLVSGPIDVKNYLNFRGFGDAHIKAKHGGSIFQGQSDVIRMQGLNFSGEGATAFKGVFLDGWFDDLKFSGNLACCISGVLGCMTLSRLTMHAGTPPFKTGTTKFQPLLLTGSPDGANHLTIRDSFIAGTNNASVQIDTGHRVDFENVIFQGNTNDKAVVYARNTSCIQFNRCWWEGNNSPVCFEGDNVLGIAVDGNWMQVGGERAKAFCGGNIDPPLFTNNMGALHVPLTTNDAAFAVNRRHNHWNIGPGFPNYNEDSP